MLLLEGLSGEIVETFGSVTEERIVLEKIVKLDKEVSVGVSVGEMVLLPLTFSVGCGLVVVPVVILFVKYELSSNYSISKLS